MIITREAKGSKLTHAEMDGNFEFLDKSFEYPSTRPTTIPLGKILEYKGELYKPAGSHIAGLTGCSPNLAIRFLIFMDNPPYTVPITGTNFGQFSTLFAFQSFMHSDNVNTVDFSLHYSSIYYTGMWFQSEALSPKIPGVTTITQFINTNLLINLRDVGTGASIIFSGGMGQQGRNITRGAFIQFFTDLPIVNRTTTIQIGSNIVNGGPLTASDILIATSKGYTVNVI